MTKSSLLEKIAGKHRASIVANILNDTETLEEAYSKVLNSEGSAMEEFQKRTESITYALNELKVTWQAFSLNAIETDTILYTIEQLENLLNTVSEIGLVELVSSLAGAFGSLFVITKIIPFLKAEGLKETGNTITTLTGKIVTVGKSIGDTSSKIEQISHLSAGFTIAMKNILKTASKFAGVGLAITAVITTIGRLVSVIEDYTHKTENLNNEVNYAKIKLNELNEELAVLKENTNLTDGEQKRIEVLKEQIELQEKILENKKKQADDSLIGDISGYFNNSKETTLADFDIFGVLDNDFTKKMEKARESVDKYSSTLDYLDDNYENVKNSQKDVSKYLSNIVLYEDDFVDLSKSLEKYKEEQENLPVYYEEAANAISDLLPYRQSLNEIINTGTELQKARARTLLAELDVMLYESKVVLGLADSFESATKKYIEFSDKAEKIDNIIKNISENGNILTFENMEKLKEVFSEEDYKIIAEIIAESSDKVAEGYKLEKEAIDELLAAKNELEEKSITANKNRIEAEIHEIDKVIKAYQLENEALISIYTTLEKAKGDASAPQYYGLANLPTLDREYQEYQDAIAKREELRLELARINEEIENLNNSTSNSGSVTTTNNNDLNNKISSWNEYLHMLEKATEEIEKYGEKVNLAEAKLNLNQSNENRNLTVIEEEQRLYAELINAKKQHYKIVNDTLYSQMQQLDVLAEQAAIASGINIDALRDMTDVEIDKHIEFNLNADSDNDQAVIKLLEGFKALKNSVQENHVLWYELKEDIAKTEFDSISVRIDFQNDFLDQFDEARQNSEKLLDIFEEMENTEENRLTIVQSLVDSYETELNSAMELHKSNAQTMLNLIKENKENTSEYQALVKQNISLEEHMLDNIQSEFNYRKELLEIEKERAIANAEASVYGNEGQKAWEQSRENEIKRLREQLEVLEEEDSEEKYLKELEEKEKLVADLEQKLANLRNEKNIQQLQQLDDGSYQWTYVEDQVAIDETIEDLNKAKEDLQSTKAEKALKDEKDAIQKVINAIQEEINSRAEKYQQLEDEAQRHYDAELAKTEQYTTEQIQKLQKHVVDTGNALNDLDKKTEKGLANVAETTKVSMENLQEVYSESFSAMLNQYQSFISRAISIFWQLEAARQQAAEQAAAMTEGMINGASDSGVDGSYAIGLKKVPSNNFIARLHYGERVLTRQEAEQYNALEKDIKSGRLDAYFNEVKNNTMDTISKSISAKSMTSAHIPIESIGNSSQFVIEHLELPNVQDPIDFANEINSWMRSEFGGLVQRAKIRKAK